MKSSTSVRRVLWVAGLALAVLGSVARGGETAKSDGDVLRALSRAVSSLAARTRPAVVSIYTTKTIRMRGFGGAPVPFDSPFEEFFGRRSPRGQPPNGREFRRRGLGSGFVIDAENGYIATNNHVVAGADDIKVRLFDKRVFDAKLVGADAKTDIAVVQIKAKDLKDIKLGDSDKLKVGDFVVAARVADLELHFPVGVHSDAPEEEVKVDLTDHVERLANAIELCDLGDDHAEHQALMDRMNDDGMGALRVDPVRQVPTHETPLLIDLNVRNLLPVRLHPLDSSFGCKHHCPLPAAWHLTSLPAKGKNIPSPTRVKP